MKNKGAGWIEIIRERKNAGHKKMEDPENPEWTVYAARAHLVDYETGVEARGLLKIGRGKYMNNIQRGRNQDGTDFRAYARVIVDCDDATRELEKYVEAVYRSRGVSGPQTTQRELYNLSDDEIQLLMDDLVNYSKQQNIKILHIKYYI
jgi:hypothetical protein